MGTVSTAITGNINLVAAEGSGAPSGQGITDLDALRIYYPTWTFATR